MASFIAQRLDYSNTNVFMTVFGGACRVLLNKPRHEKEIYNDYDGGLCALMNVLSNDSTARDFIQRLYYDTEYSEEEFNRQKEIYELGRTDSEDQVKKELKELLIQHGVVDKRNANKFIRHLENKVIYQNIINEENEIEKKLAEILRQDTDKHFTQTLINDLNIWKAAGDQKNGSGLIMLSDVNGISDMDLAVAVYVTYTQSRDGMGRIWSKGKFKSQSHYKKHILNLYSCAKRLEGIEVSCQEGMNYFRYAERIDRSPNDIYMNLMKQSDFYQIVNQENVLLFCDPSYISVQDEYRMLMNAFKEKNGLDSAENVTDEELWELVDNVESVSGFIDKYGKRMPHNLGEVYARSFGYKQQEEFLQGVQYIQRKKGSCKMFICNYDLLLYRKYLKSEDGWSKEEFRTTTSVGMKKGNERIEVIWKNY